MKEFYFLRNCELWDYLLFFSFRRALSFGLKSQVSNQLALKKNTHTTVLFRDRTSYWCRVKTLPEDLTANLSQHIERLSPSYWLGCPLRTIQPQLHANILWVRNSIFNNTSISPTLHTKEPEDNERPTCGAGGSLSANWHLFQAPVPSLRHFPFSSLLMPLECRRH